MHLFILSPNRSGSTLLSSILSKKDDVTFLYTEGMHHPFWNGPTQKDFQKPGLFTLDEKLISDESNYDWDKIKEAWYKTWDIKKPIKHQKTPSDLCRIKMMEKVFENVNWIALIRDAYQNAISIKELRPSCSFEEINKHLLRCYEILLENMNNKNVTSFVTYENICKKYGLIESVHNVSYEIKEKLNSSYSLYKEIVGKFDGTV